MSTPPSTRAAKAAAAAAATSSPSATTPKQAAKAAATPTASTTPGKNPPTIPTAISTDSDSDGSHTTKTGTGANSSGTTSPTANAATETTDGLACNEAIPALLRWLTTPDGQEAITSIGTNIITRFLQDATAVNTLTTAVSNLLQDESTKKAVAFAGAHLLQYSPLLVDALQKSATAGARAGATSAIERMIVPDDLTDAASTAMVTACNDEHVRAEIRSTLYNVIDAELSDDISKKIHKLLKKSIYKTAPEAVEKTLKATFTNGEAGAQAISNAIKNSNIADHKGRIAKLEDKINAGAAVRQETALNQCIDELRKVTSNLQSAAKPLSDDEDGVLTDDEAAETYAKSPPGTRNVNDAIFPDSDDDDDDDFTSPAGRRTAFASFSTHKRGETRQHDLGPPPRYRSISAAIKAFDPNQVHPISQLQLIRQGKLCTSLTRLEPFTAKDPRLAKAKAAHDAVIASEVTMSDNKSSRISKLSDFLGKDQLLYAAFFQAEQLGDDNGYGAVCYLCNHSSNKKASAATGLSLTQCIQPRKEDDPDNEAYKMKPPSYLLAHLTECQDKCVMHRAYLSFLTTLFPQA